MDYAQSDAGSLRAGDDKHLSGGRKRHLWYRFLQILAQGIISALFRIRVFGRENLPKRGGVLIVSNHQSYLDPVLIGVGLRRPVTFMARDTLFRHPLFGLLIKSLNAFPIKRGRLDAGAMREAEERLKSGWQLLLFPEGTRTRNGQIGRVKPGFGLLAARGGVPVIPAAIYGAFEVWPRGHRMFLPLPIRVAFGKPIAPEEVLRLGPRALADRVCSDIRGLRASLERGVAPSGPVER